MAENLPLLLSPVSFSERSRSLLAKVNVVKQTTSTVFASVDSGFNHLIRPMLYGSNHQIVNISNPKGKERYYSVVGYICETDTFGSNRRINEISEGDVLCFKMPVLIALPWPAITIPDIDQQKYFGTMEKVI